MIQALNEKIARVQKDVESMAADFQKEREWLEHHKSQASSNEGATHNLAAWAAKAANMALQVGAASGVASIAYMYGKFISPVREWLERHKSQASSNGDATPNLAAWAAKAANVAWQVGAEVASISYTGMYGRFISPVPPPPPGVAARVHWQKDAENMAADFQKKERERLERHESQVSSNGGATPNLAARAATRKAACVALQVGAVVGIAYMYGMFISPVPPPPPPPPPGVAAQVMTAVVNLFH